MIGNMDVLISIAFDSVISMYSRRVSYMMRSDEDIHVGMRFSIVLALIQWKHSNNSGSNILRLSVQWARCTKQSHVRRDTNHEWDGHNELLSPWELKLLILGDRNASIKELKRTEKHDENEKKR